MMYIKLRHNVIFRYNNNVPRNSKLSLLILFLTLILIHPLVLNKYIGLTEHNMNNHQISISANEETKRYFAGGCFWCMEPVFDVIEGVLETTVGYMGGKSESANYQDVSSGTTNHFEVIEVRYDPTKVSYETLLHAFWRSIDPTDPNGQFADKGRHYQTAIFIKSEKDRDVINETIAALLKQKEYEKPIVTKILPESSFYQAEEYHQDYYKKNSFHYNAYKIGSGRASYLKKNWGNSTDK